ncbi:MAG TPA: CBS domain-containing protein [Streptosporangiaceae bacterium]|nr:CBS domain-containing protein [Streptosporangiaceae bacterium]
MTPDVVTAGVDTPFKELAAIMTRRGVSALPVLDGEGRVAGVVSEADLLPKQEFQEDPTARPLPWWRRWAARDRTAGTIAGDLMTAPAVTIGPDESVVAAARLMERRKIKRLPVAGPDARLEGIVSRCDLVRVFLRPDAEIREEIIDEVFTDFLGTNPALVRVTVTEGVVTLAGEVEKKSMIPFAVRMSRSVDGVVDVADELTFTVDDTRLPPVPDLTSY